ncbi:hypothetical protein JXA47_02035 [Candidatus Sumerlaeota bacterium]|jgi:hypothetical protein|nr:hypothetical protein [Candidatus Sumerlaeota bacterium]
MNTYRCIVKFGHVGSGKYAERAIYVRARDATSAMMIAKNRRGVKKGRHLRSGASVLTVVRVD